MIYFDSRLHDFARSYNIGVTPEDKCVFAEAYAAEKARLEATMKTLNRSAAVRRIIHQNDVRISEALDACVRTHGKPADSRGFCERCGYRNALHMRHVAT